MILSLDAMGGDDAPKIVVDGVDLFAKLNDCQFILHGNEGELSELLASKSHLQDRVEIRHTEKKISSSDKPSYALRRGKGTSMWNAIEEVKTGSASAAVSAGNTGALMAISMLVLRKMDGVHRPGMTAIWPTQKGQSVVLDVGANLEASAQQLVSFALMGEAYARAVTKKNKPTVGLLNIGSEEVKGHDEIREAAELLKSFSDQINFVGFVEGNDISVGDIDVIVTDGFTGNVALKTAEGLARMFTFMLKNALSSSILSKLGVLLASGSLAKFKEDMNPSNVNGGVLLGLNGIVVKSHGGTDAKGFATAMQLAATLAESAFIGKVSERLAELPKHSVEFVGVDSDGAAT